MRLLVDTNVFLDLILNRDQSGIEAENFFRNCFIAKFRTYLTSISFRDIGYITHQAFHDNDKSLKAQFRAYELCSKVISITADDSINSLFSDVKDYEDSLLIEAAKRELLDAIITNNTKDFKNCEVPVFTPKEFNRIIMCQTN